MMRMDSELREMSEVQASGKRRESEALIAQRKVIKDNPQEASYALLNWDLEYGVPSDEVDSGIALSFDEQVTFDILFEGAAGERNYR